MEAAVFLSPQASNYYGHILLYELQQMELSMIDRKYMSNAYGGWINCTYTDKLGQLYRCNIIYKNLSIFTAIYMFLALKPREALIV